MELRLSLVSERDRVVVERFKRSLLNRGVPLCRCVLFGSRARGDCRPDSDFDVLVVVERFDPATRAAIDDAAWETGFDDGLLIVPVTFTCDELENSPMRSSLLALAVRAEGVPV